MLLIRICNACGWAHVGQTADTLKAQALSFQSYIEQQPPETQAQFGYGPLSRDQAVFDLTAHLKSSEHCFSCQGSYLNFHDETPEDRVPQGSTLQPIRVDISSPS